jgi:hypothetical protein
LALLALLLVTSLGLSGLVSCGGVSTAQPAGPAAVVAPPATAPEEPPVPLPNQDGSLKFAVLGDFGTGERPSFDIAAQMAQVHTTFPFEVVLTVGDNIYGSESGPEMVRKFEVPYKPLLDKGVKFYATLGNHDARNQRFYKPFNMDGKLFYSFKAPKGAVRFYALESTHMSPEQLGWVEEELKSTTDEWKIAYFHHPLYSSAGAHGSTLPLRRELEPLFVRYNVSVVFTGHDHTYERTTPQQGIVHFVVGSGGKLRPGDLRPNGFTAKGIDDEYIFLVAEIVDDSMYFNAIARTGKVVDSGIVLRRQEPQ